MKVESAPSGTYEIRTEPCITECHADTRSKTPARRVFRGTHAVAFCHGFTAKQHFPQPQFEELRSDLRIARIRVSIQRALC